MPVDGVKLEEEEEEGVDEVGLDSDSDATECDQPQGPFKRESDIPVIESWVLIDCMLISPLLLLLEEGEEEVDVVE